MTRSFEQAMAMFAPTLPMVVAYSGGADSTALLLACHRDRQAMDEPEVLVAAAMAAGLDGTAARAVLQSDRCADAVREREALYTSAGIHSVPAVIVNDQYLISGGQPAEVFEQSLRQIAANGSKS